MRAALAFLWLALLMALGAALVGLALLVMHMTGF